MATHKYLADLVPVGDHSRLHGRSCFAVSSVAEGVEVSCKLFSKGAN